MTKKRRIGTGILVIIAAVIIGVGFFLRNHDFIDGEFFPKGAAQYDLTGHSLTVEQYERIRARFPDAKILWTVPFQGARYPMDTKSLAVQTLTQAEADSLDLLPELQLVDATACTDYSALVYLQQRRPEVEVRYHVSVGGAKVEGATRELTAADVDAAELEAAIPVLTRLEAVTMEGKLPEPEAVEALQASFPHVAFGVTLEEGGQSLPLKARSVDLSGASVSGERLEQVLPLFSDLEEIDLTGTDLEDGELKSLAARFPDIFFLCDLDFAGRSFSTDAQEIDISGCVIAPEEVEETLPFFPRLKKLIMSDCGIDDETMDALNRRYPDISIVWTVQIGLSSVRTDATFFYPASVNERVLPRDEDMEKLRYCPDMIAVDMGHSKITNCEWVRYVPHLKYLIIAHTDVTDLTPLSQLKELIYLEVFTTRIKDYSPLLGCTALQDLNIGTTHADPEPLSHMTWLHNLKWCHGADDPRTRSRVLMLSQQLPDTNVWISTHNLNISEPWRYLPNYYVFRDIIGALYFNQGLVVKYWGEEDSAKILSTERDNPAFAGDVLAQIVRYRIDNGLPIPGVKNTDSEKAEILYRSLCDAQS